MQGVHWKAPQICLPMLCRAMTHSLWGQKTGNASLGGSLNLEGAVSIHQTAWEYAKDFLQCCTLH